MDTPTLELVEQQRWIAPAENAVHNAVHGAFSSLPSPVMNFLHGTWLGHPLHPVLTDIPIGSWSASLILDLLDSFGGRGRYARGAETAIGFGLAGATAAAVTGLADWQHTDGDARRIGLVHATLNITAFTLFGASLVMRRRRQHTAGRMLSLLGFAVAAGGAWLGGKLVYTKQIGVDHTAGEPLPADWVDVLAENELREGEPRRVMANGVKVLLLRRGEKIYGLAEVCSHLGGPLAEGEIEGNTVRCPWHGSRFSLEDGSVINGPATHPQPCFEARVRGGRIEVRAPGTGKGD